MKRRKSWLRRTCGWLLAFAAVAALALAVLSYVRPTTLTVQRPPRGVIPPHPPEGMFLESRGGRVIWLWQRAENLSRMHRAALHVPRRVDMANVLQSNLPGPTALNDPVDAPEGWLQWIGLAARSVGPLPAAGVMTMPGDPQPTVSFTEIMLPYWLIVPALGLAAARLLVPERRSRRWAREGRCPRCGYDLRESPQRCPECGQRVSPRPREGAPAAIA